MSPEDVKPEWVEKAARILCEISERDGHTYPGSFGINWDDTDAFWDDALRVLAAVLPEAMAEAWDEGEEAGLENAMYVGWEHLQTPNPYREGSES
jgi:hypothetical protein